MSLRNALPGNLSGLAALALALLLASGCGGLDDKKTYSVSGTVTSGGNPLPGVTVTISGAGSGTAVTDANGNYGFGGLDSGTYTLTPSLAGYTFSPTYRNVFLYGNNGEGFNFSAGRPIQVSTSTHTLFQRSDGTAWAWGNNADGQLGDGTTMDRSSAVQVTGLTGVIAVAAGGAHSLALKNDGTVWAWGGNATGQLGNGTTSGTPTTAPVQVSGLTGVTAISAGNDFSMALKSNGTVWTWGNGMSGQLGNGTTGVSSTPVQVTGLSGIAGISAGYDHAMAMNANNANWLWGGNSRGQLCVGNTSNYSLPVLIGLSVTAVSAGNQFSVALVRNGLNGDVYACGANDSGQLGNGTTMDSWGAVQITMGSLNIVAVAAGTDHVLALNADGTVWAWGNNSAGELGNNTTVNSSVPVHVPGLTGVQGVAAGNRDSFSQDYLNAISAWGSNGDGQLGDTTTTNRWSPVAITLP